MSSSLATTLVYFFARWAEIPPTPQTAVPITALNYYLRVEDSTSDPKRITVSNVSTQSCYRYVRNTHMSPLSTDPSVYQWLQRT